MVEKEGLLLHPSLPRLSRLNGLLPKTRPQKRETGAHQLIFLLFFLTIGCSGGGSSPPLKAVPLSAGVDHTCAVLSNGSVRCWGTNFSGELGSAGDHSSIPLEVKGVKRAVAVSAGGSSHTCALLFRGTVSCWGNNFYGQLGDGVAPGTSETHPAPVAVAGITNAAAIAAGYAHTCVLLSNGAVKCWGWNAYGQIGDGAPLSFDAANSTPISVSGVTNATSIAAGQYHTCALLEDKTVKCWGNNGSHELGDGGDIPSPTPVPVEGLTNAVGLSAGHFNTCAILEDGQVKCWGGNFRTQLANGGTSFLPVVLNGITSAITTTGGFGHTCVLLAEGMVKCFGDNFYAQLGNGKTENSLEPVEVIGVSHAIAITAGGSYTCALLFGNAIRCWGLNNFGQLGNGVPSSDSAHVQSEGISTAIGITAGARHTCAILADRTVQCWGYNGSGQLGNGAKIDAPQPVPVPGISTSIALTAGGDLFNGGDHTCVVLSDGTVKCWGSNGLGQLGDGTTTDSNVPVAVNGITTAVAVTAGAIHTCALLSDGAVQCWGVLGAFFSALPVNVTGISSATAISAGTSNTCALLPDGTIQCWGPSYPDPSGDNTVIHLSSPPIAGAIAVSAGGTRACALMTGSTIVECWSDGFSGGEGVIWLGNVSSIAVGTTHLCAILDDGTVTCQGGGNQFRQLGDGSVNATMIAAGATHTCAILPDQTVRCWGDNYFGQLGDGKGADYSPVSVIGF